MTVQTSLMPTGWTAFSRKTLMALICLLLPWGTLRAQPTSQQEGANQKLPPGVNISGPVDPLMKINDALISREKLEEFKRLQTDYVQALRSGEITSQSRKLIREGIETRLYAMTIPEQYGNINGLRRTFMRDLVNYAGANQINPRIKRKFREMVLTETLDVLKDLLQNQLDVRVVAAAIAGELNIVEEDRRTQTPAEPFEPSLMFLVAILEDAKQHQAVKINAVQGIIRIISSEQVKLPRNDLLQTALVMEQQLKDADTYYWYQIRLIQGLVATQIDVNRAGEPFIVTGLVQTMSDANRDPRVRSQAAYSLPRVPIPGNVNLGIIAWQVARTCEQLALEYNEKPGQIYWISTFLKIYGAFQPLKKGQEQGLIYLTSQAGFAAHQPMVATAYDNTLPVVKAVFNNKGGVKLAPNTIVPLTDWLKENDPGQNPIYPGGPTAAQLTANLEVGGP
ncbi:MAG: hypothetical protein HUJ26_07405 [Planctomycetaceae bacterium]|nr:hypothetical protein [Planctomycetaceae bacterium]